MPSNPTITPEQHRELEAATIRNIIEKVASGGIPTAREIAMLRDATQSPATTADRWPQGKVAELLDLTRQRIEQLARAGVIPSPNEAGWDWLACNHGYIAKLRERNNDQAKADRARKLKADADMAEMLAAEKSGQLSDRAQVCFDLKDTITRGAAAIGRLKTLTPAQKQSVLRILRETKLPPLSKT